MKFSQLLKSSVKGTEPHQTVLGRSKIEIGDVRDWDHQQTPFGVRQSQQAVIFTQLGEIGLDNAFGVVWRLDNDFVGAVGDADLDFHVA